MFWIIGLILLIMLIPLLRIVGILLLLIFCLTLFTSSDKSVTVTALPLSIMTYQELVDYPMDCNFKDLQLIELKNLQTVKNFDPDPDLLEDSDRAFNSRLKATIWWYAYRCDQ
jgi:hypothetical protein